MTRFAAGFLTALALVAGALVRLAFQPPSKWWRR